MRIIAILRHIFDPQTVRVSRTLGILDTRKATKFINPSDKNSLEEALRLKDEGGAEVLALSVGPQEAEDGLREALAMGVDRAVLIEGEGLDESQESLVLAQAIGRMEEFDLVVVGHHLAGYGPSQVGPRLADLLGLPQITRAYQVETSSGKVKAKAAREGGYAILEAPLPALLTVHEGANQPHYPTLAGIASAYREGEVALWNLADLGLDAATLAEGEGVAQVRETQAAPEEEGEKIVGEAKQVAQTLLSRLKSWEVLR